MALTSGIAHVHGGQAYVHGRMVLRMVNQPTWPAEALRALLHRVLVETGMSQSQLADLVPMDQSQLSRWRSGSSKPKHESLIAMGKALRERYPALGIGPDEMAATVYPRTVDAPTVEQAKPPVSEAEAAGISAVDMIRAAVSKEFESLREMAREQQETIEALVDEVRAWRENDNDKDKAG